MCVGSVHQSEWPQGENLPTPTAPSSSTIKSGNEFCVTKIEQHTCSGRLARESTWNSENGLPPGALLIAAEMTPARSSPFGQLSHFLRPVISALEVPPISRQIHLSMSCLESNMFVLRYRETPHTER